MSRFPIIRLPLLRLRGRDHAWGCKRKYCGSLVLFVCFLLYALSTAAQCPANLGFESGTFENWTCLSGRFDSLSQVGDFTETGILKNRHTILKRNAVLPNDPYGNFPVNSPNGSNYSIRLGNDSVGGQIDGVSYTFTVPPDKDVYSIIYNYAVVLQNPSHSVDQQPRFIAKVFDVATNEYIECSSFDFAASANLPGFKQSTAPRGANVFYKPWSPVTIKLIGYAGKTLKIEFASRDCKLGAHFGYAYLDINEDCSTPIEGNMMCLGVPSTLLVGPYGFREYHWYNADFTRLLGQSNTLRLDPLPPLRTVYALEVLPYPGSGCVDTLYTTMLRAPAGFHVSTPDSVGACPPELVDLTSATLNQGSTPGLRFSYFTDATLSSYAQDPTRVDRSGLYYIKAASAEGCIDMKTIRVVLDTVPKMTVNPPPPYYYPQNADLTKPELVNVADPTLIFSYWKDPSTTIAVSKPGAVEIAGTYYIKASSRFGCSVVEPVEIVMQIPPPTNVFSPNGDGINDVWETPALNKYNDCVIDIYDRTGRPVYHSVGYGTPWNGMANGKPLPVATYYYVIKASDRLAVLTGSITLLR